MAADNSDATAFQAVLSDPVFLANFVQSCQDEHSDENIQFWLAIQDFKAAAKRGESATALRKRGLAVIRKFVSTGAPQQVNMVDSAREALARAVREACTPEVFDEHEGIVYKGLLSDSFKRYRLSGRYDKYLIAGSGGSPSTSPDDAGVSAGAGAGDKRLSSVTATSGGSDRPGSPLVLDAPTEEEAEEIVTRMRKREILGMKISRSHSRKDKLDFERLGSLLRETSMKAGFILKRGDRVQTWQRRWFVATPQMFGYFVDERVSAPKRVILTREVTGIKSNVDALLDRRFSFALETPGRMYCFQCANERDHKRWIEAISEILSMESEATLAGPGGLVT